MNHEDYQRWCMVACRLSIAIETACGQLVRDRLLYSQEQPTPRTLATWAFNIASEMIPGAETEGPTP